MGNSALWGLERKQSCLVLAWSAAGGRIITAHPSHELSSSRLQRMENYCPFSEVEEVRRSMSWA